MRACGLVGAMLAGALTPQAYGLANYVPYFVFAMLWLAFLDAPLHRKMVTRLHLAIVLTLVGLALLSFFVLLPFDRRFATVAFMIAITPTATAAPSVISLLGGDAAFVAVSVLLTHLTVSLFIPFFLPHLVDAKTGVNIRDLVIPSMKVAVLPMLASLPCRLLPSGIYKNLLHLKKWTLVLWCSVLFMVTSKASWFVRTSGSATTHDLLIITAIAATICTISFSFGRFLGGTEHPKEGSQCLGQKNTLLTIWISLHFLNPFIALGPTIYVVCHNLFNSWQILASRRGRR